MMKLALVLLLAAALPAPALGADPVLPVAAAPAEAPDAYYALIDAIVQGVDPVQVAARMKAQMKNVLMTADPDLTAFEKKYPGTIGQIVEAMDPVFEAYAARLTLRGRTELHGLLAARMAAADAREAAEFYGSPLGRKMMGKIAENFSVSARLRDALDKDETITTASVRQDVAVTAKHTIAALDPDDLVAIKAQLRGKAWVPSLEAVLPEIRAANVRMMNEPLAPDEEAMIERIIDTVMSKRLAAKG